MDDMSNVKKLNSQSMDEVQKERKLNINRLKHNELNFAVTLEGQRYRRTDCIGSIWLKSNEPKTAHLVVHYI